MFGNNPTETGNAGAPVQKTPANEGANQFANPMSSPNQGIVDLIGANLAQTRIEKLKITSIYKFVGFLTDPNGNPLVVTYEDGVFYFNPQNRNRSSSEEQFVLRTVVNGEESIVSVRVHKSLNMVAFNHVDVHNRKVKLAVFEAAEDFHGWKYNGKIYSDEEMREYFKSIGADWGNATELKTEKGTQRLFACGLDYNGE